MLTEFNKTFISVFVGTMAGFCLYRQQHPKRNPLLPAQSFAIGATAIQLISLITITLSQFSNL